MSLFITFCVLNIVNVILQTVKSLMTVKCGKWGAAAINAVAFGLYQVILVYAVCDLPLFTKVAVVAVANFIGVFFTKLVEEKLRKDRLWKVEATIYDWKAESLAKELERRCFPFNYIPHLGRHAVFNIYCESKHESAQVKEILVRHGAKFFASENKTL